MYCLLKGTCSTGLTDPDFAVCGFFTFYPGPGLKTKGVYCYDLGCVKMSPALVSSSASNLVNTISQVP